MPADGGPLSNRENIMRLATQILAFIAAGTISALTLSATIV